jgi:hypothetical protein
MHPSPTGMPKENSEAVARPFKEAKEALRERFAQEVYRVSSHPWPAP